MADERADSATPDRLASTPASYVRDLLVIGDAAIRWRQLAEQMERERNAAHQEIVALDALAARLTADLAAERARSERLREAGERLHSELLDVAFGWDLGLPQRCQDDAHVALDAWDAAADDAQRDGSEGTEG